ncbi:MAG TPA: GTPase Era [Gemmatimonadaceae bacterium]|nr:GTPase Era [Gemmatimonadaceae bacterium]
MTRAGIVTVVGKPNAGKSTLLNRLIGEKLSITSEKPQSTRDRIVGITTKDDVQMIVLDTPGLLEPRYELQRSMRATALKALDDADVIVYLADARDGAPPPLRKAAELDRDPRAPIIVALNKVDAVTERAREALRREAPDAVHISALTGEGIHELQQAITPHLPESPFLYPEDEIGTQSLRFFTSELVRETALEQLEDEVPYSVACGIEEFREDRSPVYIRAVIYVERESQKGILVGHQGARIRELGRAARLKIERLVGKPVYLDLWVKVLPNWRRNVHSLRRLGYALPEEPRR